MSDPGFSLSQPHRNLSLGFVEQNMVTQGTPDFLVGDWYSTVILHGPNYNGNHLTCLEGMVRYEELEHVNFLSVPVNMPINGHHVPTDAYG